MESQDNLYRKAMIEMRKSLYPHTPAKVCVECYGWEHFGGVNVEDVTKGPMCVCDKNWYRVHAFLKKKKHCI